MRFDSCSIISHERWSTRCSRAKDPDPIWQHSTAAGSSSRPASSLGIRVYERAVQKRLGLPRLPYPTLALFLSVLYYAQREMKTLEYWTLFLDGCASAVHPVR